jgi:hypothetical protein
MKEGLAAFLGSDEDVNGVTESFPEALVTNLGMESAKDGDYGVAMQFVGSLIEQHGVARFKEFRAEVAPDAPLEDVAAAFERVYGEDFEDALVAMSTTAVRGQLVDDTCDGEIVSWSSNAPFRADLTATCGDGWYYGGLGFNLLLAPHEEPSAYAKPFVLDVPESAIYTFTVAGADLRALGVIRACGDTPGDGSGVSYRGYPNTAVLEAGKYELFVGFPEGASTDVTVTLEFQSPLPTP